MDPEKSIPAAVLRGAKGLAILTVAKFGAVLTYKVGTGLVVARRSDGSWSAPSAILSVGLGWGPQVMLLLVYSIFFLETCPKYWKMSARIFLQSCQFSQLEWAIDEKYFIILLAEKLLLSLNTGYKNMYKNSRVSSAKLVWYLLMFLVYPRLSADIKIFRKKLCYNNTLFF